MYSTIIIDDEISSLNETCRLAENTGFLSVIGKYQSPLKALEAVETLSPLVAFVDIDLPEMDGITLAERILEIDPDILVVFITGHNEYAVEAFELNALDYLLKPIRIKRFNAMTEKIKQKLDKKVENISSKLTVNVFGKLEVKIGDELILWKRSKAEEVFAYLMVNHGCFVRKEEIVDKIWPEYDFATGLSILKTSICRIRSVLAGLKNEVKVLYSGGRYCLTLDIKNTESDYLQLCQALADYRENNVSTYEAVEKACDIYNRGFLSQQGYIWSIEKDEELRKQLLSIMGEIAQQYCNQNSIAKYLKALKCVAELAPYYEQTNNAYMKKLEQLGEYQQIVMHYTWLEKILKEQYDSEPSKRIIDSFGKYIKKR